MATAAGTQGCGPGSYPNASVFLDHVPKRVDTEQWCEAVASFGGKWATLVAKHEVCVCVCVCVCVKERETERKRQSMCVCVSMCVCAHAYKSVPHIHTVHP